MIKVRSWGGKKSHGSNHLPGEKLGKGSQCCIKKEETEGVGDTTAGRGKKRGVSKSCKGSKAKKETGHFTALGPWRQGKRARGEEWDGVPEEAYAQGGTKGGRVKIIPQ